jgi:CRISPR-associated protein Csa1
MVYFASAEETRYIQRGLLLEARRNPVLDELRGWSWPEPPLRPIYARLLDVMDVQGDLCPTGRDLYLAEAEGVPRALSSAAAEGSLLKAALASALREAKALIFRYGVDAVDHLERMAEEAFAQLEGDVSAIDADERRRDALWRLRAFEARRVLERFSDVLATVGPAGADALAALALPIDVDVPMNGRLLGLTTRVMADAVSFRDGMVFAVEFDPPDERHYLATAGLALVAESIFERPFDLGCVVYPRVLGNRVEAQRDFHVIGDEVRQIFVEERDDRMHLLDAGVDPGLPAHCPASCPHLLICHPPVTITTIGAPAAVPATRRVVGAE